ETRPRPGPGPPPGPGPRRRRGRRARRTRTPPRRPTRTWRGDRDRRAGTPGLPARAWWGRPGRPPPARAAPATDQRRAVRARVSGDRSAPARPVDRPAADPGVGVDAQDAGDVGGQRRTALVGPAVGPHPVVARRPVDEERVGGAGDVE